MSEILHKRVMEVLPKIGYKVTHRSYNPDCLYGWPGFCALVGHCVQETTMNNQAEDGDLDPSSLTRYCRKVCEGAVAAGCSRIVYAGDSEVATIP